MKPQLYIKPADLAPELQSWLDGRTQLPKEILFYPAQTKSWGSVVPWFALALLFIAMGTAAPITFLNQLWQNGFTPRTGYFLFGMLFLAIFLVVLLYGILAGAIRDVQLIWAKRNGRLRHGVFITNQDVLIRLPHEMHYLPRYSFTKAEETTIQHGGRSLKVVQIPITDNAEPLVIRPKLTISNQALVTHINHR